MVNQPVRKELTQCKNCWKSRLDGVPLSKCAGCKIALYCSKECQKAAWPEHKKMCIRNSEQEASLSLQSKSDSLDRLRAYCAKHRPSLANYGIDAFDLLLDGTVCMRKALVVYVEPNPVWDNKKAEGAFVVVDAELTPLETFGEKKEEELREQIKSFHDKQKRSGALGGFMVVIFDTTSGVMYANWIGFKDEVFKSLKVGQEWKEPLLRLMNSGTIF